MASPSHFRRLAYLINVGDICSPFLSSFDCEQTVADVNEEWGIDLCHERSLDPMDQICLVTHKDKVAGWVGYDMLETGKVLAECLEPITPDVILTSDTPLIEAVTAFSKTKSPFFLIIRGNEFIGWLSYKDLHKPPLRLCLFAMLINLERMLLEVALLSPHESIRLLSEGRFKKAKEIYSLRKYDYDEHGQPYYSKLLECTTIADKLHIMSKSKHVRKAISALDNTNFCRFIEKLRNEIAHPGQEEKSSDLLERGSIWPFIEWSEKLEIELQEYLDKRRKAK